MSKILIIINAETDKAGKILSASPATEKMLETLRQAITNSSNRLTGVEVISAASLWSHAWQGSWDEKTIYCPLTIQLPDSFSFPARPIFKACRDIQARRDWVAQYLNYKTSFNNSWLGDLWLPIVLTAKGPLYAEVIGEGAIPNFYEQPVDLADELRQPLYYLAYRLLESIAASPAVYLLQFSLQDDNIVFDRLWPFPAAPALSSLQVQDPNLFTCHWHCLTYQPLLDVAIMGKTVENAK